MEHPRQLSDWHDPESAEEYLREGYSDRLYYHIYDHAIDTRTKARELGKWCAYNGQIIDFYVLDWAALGHDYGYLEYDMLPEDVRNRYPTREKYAAAMTGGIMASFGAPQTAIRQVKEAIWSTEVGVGCTSKEGRILRQADLANVGGKNRADFFINTIKLYREYRLLGGENPNLFFAREFINYCIKSNRVLSIYNTEDVSLGDFDKDLDGHSTFCKNASENIRMLLPDRIQKLAELAGSKLLADISDN
ncbi:MAG TPA: hypothetical protein VFI84_01060 [Candidatus Saccharimonadales bacterium]|nr:hypothetical protein [Candidatus Saccharimonadales bacterium]